MELKEILSHAEAVQFLLYSIQHGKQTRTALKKALPELYQLLQSLVQK